VLVDSLEVSTAQEVEDRWVEHQFWTLQALLLDRDVVSTWQLVLAGVSVRLRLVSGILQLRVVVHRYLSVLLLDLDADVLTLTVVLLLHFVGGVWMPVDMRWVILVEQFLKERGKVSTTDWNLSDSVWDGVSLINWYCVSYTLSSVKNCTGGTASGEQREHTLVAKVKLWNVEFFEH